MALGMFALLRAGAEIATIQYGIGYDLAMSAAAPVLILAAEAAGLMGGPYGPYLKYAAPVAPVLMKGVNLISRDAVQIMFTILGAMVVADAAVYPTVAALFAKRDSAAPASASS